MCVFWGGNADGFRCRGWKDEVSSSAGPKTGFMAKLSALAQPLGQRLGGLSKGKAAAGKGRVRPKDHLEALEHQHSHLQQMKARPPTPPPCPQCPTRPPLLRSIARGCG